MPQASSGPVGSSSMVRNCDMGHSMDHVGLIGDLKVERDLLTGRTIGHREPVKQEEDKVWQNFRLPSEHQMDSKRPLLPLLSYEKREENENMFDSLYDPANNDE